MPAEATGYAMPTIEGFDADKAATSPAFAALRNAAFAGGIGQAGFETAVKDYVAGETARFDASAAEEKAKLGANGASRLKAVGQFVRGSVSKEHAEAILAGATTADAVIGLEALMNSRATAAPRTPPPAADQRETKEQIEAIMATPAYSGKPGQRDPSVVAKVDAWFAAEAAAKK